MCRFIPSLLVSYFLWFYGICRSYLMSQYIQIIYMYIRYISNKVTDDKNTVANLPYSISCAHICYSLSPTKHSCGRQLPFYRSEKKKRMGKKESERIKKKDHSRGRVHVRRLFSTQRTVFVWLFLAFSFFCSFSFTSLLQLSPCISHESFYFYLPYLPPYITSSTFYRRTKLNSTQILGPS